MFWIILAVIALVLFVAGIFIVRSRAAKIGLLGEGRTVKDADYLLNKKKAKAEGKSYNRQLKHADKIAAKAQDKPWKYDEEGKKRAGKEKRQARREYKRTGEVETFTNIVGGN